MWNCNFFFFFFNASLSILYCFVLLGANPFCPDHSRDQAAGEDFPADGSKHPGTSTRTTFSLLLSLRTIAARHSPSIFSFFFALQKHSVVLVS